MSIHEKIMLLEFKRYKRLREKANRLEHKFIKKHGLMGYGFCYAYEYIKAKGDDDGADKTN